MSSRPDPATDLVGSLRWIMERLEALEDHKGEKLLSASAAAVNFGHGRNYLLQPWRIPGFGLKGTRHTLSAWTAWLDRPEAERRAEWDAMSIKDRRAARGAA